MFRLHKLVQILQEHESFKILSNNLALYGCICRVTQSPFNIPLCDLRKPEAFLSFYPDSLFDHPPIFHPPQCVVFLAAFIGIVTKCFSPLILLCSWVAYPDNPKELHKRLVNSRSVGWAWRKSAYDARSFLVYMRYLILLHYFIYGSLNFTAVMPWKPLRLDNCSTVRINWTQILAPCYVDTAMCIFCF